MASADPPLAVHGLYGSRDREHHCHCTEEIHRLGGLLAVIALALQFVTGLYLFVLPYASKWRSGRSTG